MINFIEGLFQQHLDHFHHHLGIKVGYFFGFQLCFDFELYVKQSH
jgi:hypothetical protein